MSPARGTRVARPTYHDIQRWVAATYGYRPETAWIAHVKALRGLTLRPAPNRRARRRRPCPPKKQAQIAAALRHFGLIPEHLPGPTKRTAAPRSFLAALLCPACSRPVLEGGYVAIEGQAWHPGCVRGRPR